MWTHTSNDRVNCKCKWIAAAVDSRGRPPLTRQRLTSITCCRCIWVRWSNIRVAWHVSLVWMSTYPFCYRYFNPKFCGKTLFALRVTTRGGGGRKRNKILNLSGCFFIAFRANKNILNLFLCYIFIREKYFTSPFIFTSVCDILGMHQIPLFTFFLLHFCLYDTMQTFKFIRH